METELYIKSGNIVVRLDNATPDVRSLIYERFDGYFRITESLADTKPARTIKLIESSGLLIKSTISKPSAEIKISNIFHDHDNPEVWIMLAQPTNDDSILELHLTNRTPAVCIMISRVIRSIILQLHFLQGKAFIHASAVSINGKVLAFTGPKYAGKTTCLLAMCKYTCALPVTNDKLSIYYEGSHPQAQGFPIKAGIRRGSLDLIDEDGLFNTDKMFNHDSDKVLRVTMHELARKFNKFPAHSGPLAAICLPIYDSSLEGFSISRYSSFEITGAWKDNQLKSLAEIDPEQKAIANFFPQHYDSNTIPEVPVFLCRSNSGSIKAMVEYLEQLVRTL